MNNIDFGYYIEAFADDAKKFAKAYFGGRKTQNDLFPTGKRNEDERSNLLKAIQHELLPSVTKLMKEYKSELSMDLTLDENDVYPDLATDYISIIMLDEDEEKSPKYKEFYNKLSDIINNSNVIRKNKLKLSSMYNEAERNKKELVIYAK